MKHKKILLATLIGVIGVSFASIFIKECNNVPSLVLSMYRLDIAALIMLIINFFNRQEIFPLSKKELVMSAASGIFLALHFYFWIASLKYTSIASSVTLLSTNPFFVVFISIFLRQKISKSIILALLLSFLGTIVITVSDGNIFGKKIDSIALFGDFLALIGAACVSVYFLVGASLRKTMDTNKYVTLVYASSAIFITILGILARVQIWHYSTRDFSFILLLAIVPQLIGHTAFNWVLKYLKASAVAITTLGEIVGSSFLAYIFFGQKLNLFQLIGICLVVFAIVISFRYGKV